MPESNNKKVFSNTLKSSQLRQFTFVLFGLMSIELFVVGLVCYVLIPKGQLLTIIIGIIIAYSYGAFTIYTMLISSHVLSSTGLTIRLGPRFKHTLPLTLITSVKSENLEPRKSDLIGVSIFRAGECLYCLSRKSDIIRISLSEAIMVKAPAVEGRKSKRGLVREILINVDEPVDFINTLSQDLCLTGQREKLETGDTIIASPGRVIMAEKEKTLEAGRDNEYPNLELQNLTKYYKEYPAVRDMSLKIYPGEIFGFLGANGAGKTTTIKMMTGLLKPTSGAVRVKGEDIWKPGTTIRRKIGYIPDTPLLYERLTAREHLLMAAHLYNLPAEIVPERINEILSVLDLQRWADEMIATYSMGMQRKVSAALALLPDPEIVIVDELTNAFDALTLSELKRLLLNLKIKGKTVFLSTHLMDVAEKLCDRVAIINRGNLAAVGTVKDICLRYGVEEGLESLFLKLTGTGPEVRERVS